MTTLFAEKPFPRSLLIAGGSLIFASIALAAAARYGDYGVPRSVRAPIAESLSFVAEDGATSGIVLRDAKTGAVLVTIGPGDGGFIRGVLRGFARDRRAASLSPQDAFILVRHTDGRLTLQDSGTGRTIDLDGFGPTNREAFAKLLPSRAEVKQ